MGRGATSVSRRGSKGSTSKKEIKYDRFEFTKDTLSIRVPRSRAARL